MVRYRLPSSSYYTPVGESEWSREKFGEQSIAVLPGAYRNPVEMARHVADHVSNHHPFFVMDVNAVQRRVDALRIVCPRIRPSYSIACNADPVLARLLANNDKISFEVSNSSELEMTSLHVEPSRVTLCSQLLTRKLIKKAAQEGCGTFVVENEKQLNDVFGAAPHSEILLAINLGYSTAEIPSGCDVDDVEGLIELAHMLGANLAGIHLELGPRAVLSDYVTAIQNARSVFDVAANKFVDLRRVSIGNMVIPMSGDRIDREFVMFCSTLNRTVSELFPSEVDFSANVGRFLVTNAFTLCTNIVAKQETHASCITNDDFDEGVGFVYQTNDGVYGSFGCRQMDINPLCKPLHAADLDEPQHFGTILGPSLDEADIAQKLMRCRQLRVGEWLVWEQMGAFTIPADSEHPVPPVYYYIGKECWQKLIRKDEQRRSPSPSVSDVDDMGSDCEGGYASSSCDEFETEIFEEVVDFGGFY